MYGVAAPMRTPRPGGMLTRADVTRVRVPESRAEKQRKAAE
jgi:hypothetical protein